MIPFRAPVDDILAAFRAAGAAHLPGWDDGLAAEVVGHFARFAETAIAPLDGPGDREGCRMEGGRVRMPAGFVAAYADYAAQGWPGLGLPEASGGQGLPAPILGAVTEVFAGACHSLQMVCGLVPGAARTILRFGTPEQQALWLPRLASGEWLATMALTEAGAGSDLSGIRTRAFPVDGGWRIEGEKIFISGGDQDMTDRILHLVLARTGLPEEGTRGLGLFLVPSHDEAGGRAPVRVLRIEEKLGLHASPTCQMAFDAAPATLLGEPGGGLAAMFTMMNHARLDVALQGIAHAARAHDIAATYAAGRRQGGRAIADHADVRRKLTTMREAARDARQLVHTALVALESGENPDLVDFLTPVCKVMGTEAGIRAADMAIQVLGGYGYLREYRVEQIWRDARITAIYEGTNGIHALTLATRLLRGRGSRAAEAFDGWAAQRASAGELAQWREVRDRVLAAEAPEELAEDFMHATIRLAAAAVAGFSRGTGT
ncbi:hypothetical protein FHS82_003806 [Pseudochelatococcus lubricantis]|uniref:Acyl-CoA dehydrogenase n=1 Tax=Pseudochelatococcus lubricantis TaxID=1538102 RepID=A0ABX0V625_9HYPH|nr:acyl-CoA dehydrogenase family protein [Pseudochelatococcus lubricantis]NIJ59945.1 hypothetical protein [Pseudochelatococcus lubricantis]